MKRIRVEIPFILKEADRRCVPGEILSVSEEQLGRMRAINPNLVSVLGEEDAPAQPAQGENPEQAAQAPEQAPEQAAQAPEQEKKPAKKKQSKKK